MGSALDKNPSKASLDKDTVLSFRELDITQIRKRYDYICLNYPGCDKLSKEQFLQVFEFPGKDSQKVFDIIKGKDQGNHIKCDIYESLSVFILLSGSSFSQKVKDLFKLFDFDMSCQLERHELLLTIQAIVRGLSKINGAEIPPFQILETLAKDCFNTIDLDKSGVVDLGEIEKWVAGNMDFQDFLLKCTGTQTFDNAKRRCDELFNSVTQIYLSTPGYTGAGAPVDNLKKLIENHEEFQTKKVPFEYFWKLINGSAAFTANKIKIKNFKDILRAWCAFSSADINGDNTLGSSDLKLLLWLYEGEEPSEWRVKQDLKEIDADGSGHIDRIEWLQYLSCEDPQTGQQVFRADLKKMFENYDQDGSGSLEINELQDLIQSLFTQKISTQNAQEQKDLLNKAEQLTDVLFQELNSNSDASLSWEEFKKFIDQFLEQRPDMRDILLG